MLFRWRSRKKAREEGEQPEVVAPPAEESAVSEKAAPEVGPGEEAVREMPRVEEPQSPAPDVIAPVEEAAAVGAGGAAVAMAQEEEAVAEEGVSAATAVAEPEAKEEDEVFVEEPIFEVDYKGACAYEVRVKVAAANEREQTGKVFDELKREAEVPGFRRGRAPRKLLERKFGKVVQDEVKNKLVSAAFQKLIASKGLKPISLPDIEGLEEAQDRGPGEPLTFMFKFEVFPRVELGKYRGIEIERPVATVDESDINQEIEALRTRYAVYETLEGGVAAAGDQVIIDFKGEVDGKEFRGGTAQNYPYILGSKRFYAEFEQTLLGSSPGDELTCEVRLPQDYPDTEVRDEVARFTIRIKEVKRRNLPELTDDFARQAGYASIEDMREKTAGRMRESSQRLSDRITEQRALDTVVESSTFELPKSLIQETSKGYYEQQVRDLLSMRVPVDQIRAQEEELRRKAEEESIRDIKRLVVLDEIAEAEGLQVTEEDFDQDMEETAQRLGIAMDALGDYIAEDEERRSRYEERILRAKAAKLILDHATIVDRELPREEEEPADADRPVPGAS